MPSLKEQADEALNNLRANRGERGISNKYVKRTPVRMMAMDRDLVVLWAIIADGAMPWQLGNQD